MKVVLAEKRDQAMKLAAPFQTKSGNGYIEVLQCPTFPKGAYISWCMGHLFSLKEPQDYDSKWKSWSLDSLPIIPEQFQYSIVTGRNKQFQVIKKLVKDPKVSEIIIGCDPGREGQAIGEITILMSGVKKPMKRLWTKSLTEKAVLVAFKNMRPNAEYLHLYHEAVARSQADWLVGMNTSRAYTTLLRQKGVEDTFSLGRVQTPLLSLIVEREKDIQSFLSTPFWDAF